MALSNIKKLSIGLLSLSLLVGVATLVEYGALLKTPLPAVSTTESVSFEVEEVAAGLEVPWSMVWTGNNRMLIAERPGRIRVFENGVLRNQPLHTFTDVATGGEEGLMSLAVSPSYQDDRSVYAALVYESTGKLFLKVVRLLDSAERLVVDGVVIDGIPAARFHAGSRIAFGPDGKLYITTGDATNRADAQNIALLVGKTLRLNPDGSIPADNPYPLSPVWSSGHRNAQGITWDERTGEQYQSEHGPSVFDGPAGGDEINLVVRGGNYGWPLVSHGETKEGTLAPIQMFTPAEAPGSLMSYSGDVFPEYNGNLFFGALKGEGLVRLVLSPDTADHIVSVEKLPGIVFGRIRDVAQGPDGFIYFTTSNRDGRGEPATADDRILRLVPRL